MTQMKAVSVHPVMHGQQPTGAAFVDPMVRIARDEARHHRVEDLDISRDRCAQRWASRQCAPEIGALFQRAVERGTVPGVVAIIASEKQVLYYRAARLKDVAGQKPRTPESVPSGRTAI